MVCCDVEYLVSRPCRSRKRVKGIGWEGLTPRFYGYVHTRFCIRGFPWAVVQLEEKSAHVAGSAGAESLHADYADLEESLNTSSMYNAGLC